jgi:C-terminal processing protease CtpA/Prc
MRRTRPQHWLVLFAALFTLAVPTLASAGAWLGVYTQEVSAELREAFGLETGGVLVTNVVTGSPAARAGLLKSDVIVTANKKAIEEPSDLTDLITAASPGQSVSLGIVRKGAPKTLSVKLVERPEEIETPVPPVAPMAPKAPHSEMRWYSNGEEFDSDSFAPLAGSMFMRGFGRGRLGVRLETLTEDLAAALGSTGTKGALVVEVYKKTPADSAGIRAGDIITAVGTTAVYDTDDLVKAIREEKGNVSISLVRQGKKRTVEAALEDSPYVIRLRDGKGQMGYGRLGDDGKFDIRVKGDANDEELRRELSDLRRELSELRKELQEKR